MIEQFKELREDKILLDIEIVDFFENDPYAPFDELIGLCESNRSDASVNHDMIIYGRRDMDDLC
ncbi:MAG: hypothetical protein HC887_01825 [Desulfobacteraceae bacterium]|nr:hypothetical protein [Desulfobacteraceae bacterium]